MPSDLPGDFGSGLAPSAGSPFDISPSSVNAMPDNSAPPQAAPAPQPAPTFGSSLANVLPGAHYAPPDPASSALDQSASLLQQRINRAGQIATNPLAQLFAPEQAEAARNFVPQATEQLRTIAQQKQQQVDIQRSATNFGMPQSAQNPFMTNDTIDNWLLDQYKSGDFSKAPMLQARGRGDWVQDFAPTAADGAGRRLEAASSTITKLNAAGDNQPAYAATLRNLTPAERDSITSLGQTLPEKASDWQRVIQQHGAAFMQAQQVQSQVMQRFANIANFTGTVPKDVETASQGSIRVGSSNEPAGFPVRTRAIDGQTGNVGPNGSVQMEKYGLAPKNGGWNVATTERLQNNDKLFTSADTQGAVNQYNIANKFKNEAMNDETYTSSVGLALLKDTLGGVGRDVAEKSAAAGTPALAQMFKNEQGGFEGFLNRATTEIAAYKAWVDGGRKGAPQRISDQTKRGIQFIANENYNFSQQQAAGRLSGAMRNAGQIGRPLEDIPLDADLKASVAQYHEEGRIDAINGWRSYPSVVNGNQRIFFPQGSNVMGAGAPRPPLNPDGSPLTPVQNAGQNAGALSGGAPRPAPSSSPQQPGGAGQPSPQPSGPSGPQPITVAGQQVNVALPPGASPAYVTSLQRIESGGERSPWTSGTQNSSASGAFQFLDGSRTGRPSTWEANRPPGAPARAADATPQQQADALATFTARNATALQTAGLPVNDTNLYIAHNLGADGSSRLLHADPSADARTIVGESAARDNPMFFKGRPTVATVLQRYASAVSGYAAPQLTATNAPASTGPMTPTQREALARRGVETAAPGPTPEQQAGQWAQTGPALAGAAPAALGTGGALIGGAVGGPPGAVVGGAVGSGAGQALKDYVQGNPQSPAKIAEQAALGGVLGVASEARPLLTAAGRVIGSGAIEGGSTLAQGGTGPEAVDAALKGGAEAAGGEAFGRALGMVGHKIFSLFAPDARASVQAAAKTYAETSEILKNEPNRLPGVGTAAGGPNPKYLAAEQARGEAETVLKDAGLNPEEAAYAYTVSSQGVPLQEAQVNKPGALEKQAVGAGYQQLSTDVGSAGVGTVKAAPRLTDGPMAAVANKQVSAAHAELAERTEMAITAPAANWQEKWQQLQDARSNLLQAERDALSSTATGKTQTAADMRTLADTVRTQQAKAANYVFGPQQGPQVMQRLNALDVRYRRLMDATNGGDLSQAAGLKGAAGRDADQKFRAFAAGDPTAIAAWNAMRGAGPNYEKGVLNLVAAERIPVLGKIYSGIKLLGSFNRWMQERAAGSPAKFSDILSGLPSGGAQATRNVAGTIGQRGAVQGAGATP